MLHLYSAWTLTGVTLRFSKNKSLWIFIAENPREQYWGFLCLSFKKPQWGLRGLNMNHVT